MGSAASASPPPPPAPRCQLNGACMNIHCSLAHQHARAVDDYLTVCRPFASWLTTKQQTQRWSRQQRGKLLADLVTQSDQLSGNRRTLPGSIQRLLQQLVLRCLQDIPQAVPDYYEVVGLLAELVDQVASEATRAPPHGTSGEAGTQPLPEQLAALQGRLCQPALSAALSVVVQCCREAEWHGQGRSPEGWNADVALCLALKYMMHSLKLLLAHRDVSGNGGKGAPPNSLPPPHGQGVSQARPLSAPSRHLPPQPRLSQTRSVPAPPTHTLSTSRSMQPCRAPAARPSTAGPAADALLPHRQPGTGRQGASEDGQQQRMSCRATVFSAVPSPAGVSPPPSPTLPPQQPHQQRLNGSPLPPAPHQRVVASMGRLPSIDAGAFSLPRVGLAAGGGGVLGERRQLSPRGLLSGAPLRPPLGGFARTPASGGGSMGAALLLPNPLHQPTSSPASSAVTAAPQRPSTKTVGLLLPSPPTSPPPRHSRSCPGAPGEVLSSPATSGEAPLSCGAAARAPRGALVPLREFDHSELKRATGAFAPGNQVGCGGYGPVFKGVLDCGQVVAIKVLDDSCDARQGMREFAVEARILGSLQHPHVVRLLGVSSLKGCLVYEYAAHGSLEDYMARVVACRVAAAGGTLGGTPPEAGFGWWDRVRICSEVAQALDFLHSRAEPVIHMDLKPANILLCSGLVAKLGDVGLAKLAPELAAGKASTVLDSRSQLIGTLSYIDPEYLRSGRYSTLSDVYALGMVMLQLLTGQDQLRGLVARVEIARSAGAGALSQLTDPLGGAWPLSVVCGLTDLALQCVEYKHAQRPSLRATVIPRLRAMTQGGP